jgi:hypothetical protein
VNAGKLTAPPGFPTGALPSNTGADIPHSGADIPHSGTNSPHSGTVCPTIQLSIKTNPSRLNLRYKKIKSPIRVCKV